jgi:hypothetical protein
LQMAQDMVLQGRPSWGPLSNWADARVHAVAAHLNTYPSAFYAERNSRGYG